MRSVSGREFARLVEQRGWQLLRVAGSHHIYGKPGSVVR
ncbi:MAG TPA: type II toxin-antitoxin system HicA family toxin, partial [Roseiarcus sp.]|nr:type II toxin-antitoxin system HicA family toxin [Roseiarcus sp.]